MPKDENNPYTEFMSAPADPNNPYVDLMETEPKEKTLAQKAAPYVRMGLEAAGMGIGGGVGAASGLATAGTTSYPGMLLGGTLGGAAGGLLAEEYEKMVGLPYQKRGAFEQAKHVGQELGESAAGMMLGEGLGAVARPVVNWMAGKAPMQTIAKLIGHETSSWDKADIDLLLRLSREHGIDLTAPEVLNSPTLQNLWHSIANSPGSAAEKIRQWIVKIRNPQIEQAINRESGRLGRQMSVEETGGLLKEGAKGIESELMATRQAGAGPLYKSAFEGAGPVDVSPVLEIVDSQLGKYPSGTSGNTALNRARNLLVDTEGNPNANLEMLQKSRREIADMIAQKGQHKDLTLAKEDKMLLTKVKAGLDKQMYQASPEYKEADRTFAELSKPLNELIYGDARYLPREKRTKTIIGKILDTDQNKLASAVDTVFKSTPDQIRSARRWFVDTGREDIWNQIVRGKLDKELGLLRESLANVQGGKLGFNYQQRVFRTRDDVEKLRASLSVNDFNHLKDFMNLLNRTERLAYSNSKTAMMQDTREAIDNLVLGPADVGVNLLDKAAWLANAVFHPHGTMRAMKAYRRPEKNARLADYLFDPELKLSIEQIMEMPPGKRIEAFAKMLGRIGGMEATRAISSGW